MPTFSSSGWGRAQKKEYEEAEERARRDKNPYISGLRVRHDGWTAEKTQRFLDVLSHRVRSRRVPGGGEFEYLGLPVAAD